MAKRRNEHLDFDPLVIKQGFALPKLNLQFLSRDAEN
jgi:hypothetical protein